jgi:MFS family permease
MTSRAGTGDGARVMTAAPGRRMLAALIVAVFSYALLQTLVVPALGLLQHSLHTSRTWSAWILSAFLLSSAVLTPLISRLGDRRDKRQVMLAVLVAYLAGAAGAALAQNIGELIAARVVQGVGLSLLPLSFAVIRDTLPASRARAAMGAVSAVVGAGAGAGLVIGGLLADSLSWRYLFITGAALIAVSLAAVAAWVPGMTTASTRHGGRDPAGACLLALSLTALLLALTEGPAWGWTSPPVLALFAATAVLLAALAAAEARTPDPLVDITEFTRRPALMTHLAALAFGALSYIFYVALPAYAETPRALAGYGFTASVTRAGLIMLPGALTLLAAGALAGPAAARLGPRWPATAGFTLSAAGAALLALAHAHAWQDVACYAIVGAGSGLIIAALPMLIADIVPAQRTGIANGINNIMRTVGGVIGAQVTAAILTSDAVTHLPAASAYRTLFWAAAATSAVGIVLSPLASRTRQLPQPPAAGIIAQPRAQANERSLPCHIFNCPTHTHSTIDRRAFRSERKKCHFPIFGLSAPRRRAWPGPTGAPAVAAASAARRSPGRRSRPGRAGAGPPWRRPAAPRGSPPRARAGTPGDSSAASGGSRARGRPRRSSGRASRHPQPGERGRRVGLEPGRLGG